MCLHFCEAPTYTDSSMQIPFFAKRQPQERKKSVTGRLDTEIKYSQGGYYLFYDTEHDELVRKLKPDSPEYFNWVSGLKSFHFSGKNGHFTARKETRKNKDGQPREGAYWSAYRKANKKPFRKYLGGSEKLDIATLESTAQHLEELCNAQGPKPKTQRRRPEKRKILYARITAREQTIEQRDRTIGELEQKITDQEQTIKELKASIRKLEAAAKTKREKLEL